MSIFSGAVNGFRSTVSRAGKFYNSANANKAKAVAGYMARSAKLNPVSTAKVLGAGAAVGGVAAGVGSAVTGSRHSKRNTVAGAGVGMAGLVGLGGYQTWNKMSAGAGRLGTSALRGLLR